MSVTKAKLGSARGLGPILRRVSRFVAASRELTPATRRVERLRSHTRRYAPEGTDTPCPTAILLHGCAGDKHHLEAWGRFLAHHGFLVYTIDSLSPRGLGLWQAGCMVCTGLRLQGRERARDVIDLLPSILEDPLVDRSRIHFVGWSHGAWTLTEFMLDAGAMALLDNEGASVASIVLAYPYCGLASSIHDKDWTHAAPVMVVTAGKDRVVSNARTFRFIERLRAKGIAVTHRHIEAAGHGFDVEGIPTYSAEATAELRRAMLAFLGETGGGR